jgi:hypothetical protein
MSTTTLEPEAEPPLSVMLRKLGADRTERVSIEDLTHQLGDRAFGALLFVFALVALIPTPPGGTTITGMPLLLISAQLALGVRTVWLPRVFKRQGLDSRAFNKGLDRVLPWLERVERFSRPRLGMLFGPVGDRLLGLVCTVLGLIIVLPIPGGNILPAVAVAVLAISMVMVDGVLTLVGYALVAASGVAMYLLAGVFLDVLRETLEHLRALVG